MTDFDSESSSGCESGWTFYLKHSFLPSNPSHRGNYFVSSKNGGFDSHSLERTNEEEEDLSMVSDASSGPPHFHEAHFKDDNGGYSYSTPKAKKNGKKQEVKENLIPYDSSFLDDTASSPVFTFSVENYGNESSRESSLDFSQGFSATHLQDRRLLQSPQSGSHFQRNQLG